MDYFVEDNWQFIKAGLMEILNKKVPKKKLGTQSDTPWITRDLKRLLRKKKRLKAQGKFQKHLKVKLHEAQDDFIAETLH